MSLTHNTFKEARGTVTTGVKRWFPRGYEGERAGNDTTWPATQVGPRRVEVGLGGHDAGDSGGRRGVESEPLPLSTRGRLAWSDCPTFSVFCGQVNDLEVKTETT